MAPYNYHGGGAGPRGGEPVPAEGDEAVGFVEYKSGMTDDRVLCYRPAGGAAAAGEPVAAAAPAEAAAEGAEPSLGPVPEGFEWAGLY